VSAEPRKRRWVLGRSANNAVTREASRERKTSETAVQLRLSLDGGEARISTGIGFLDHMLELVARHGRLGLVIEASGDLETGAHHTTEDVGIVLGQALDEALGDRAGIRRYGSALVPMDEALAECALDISGRPYCDFAADLPATSIAGFDSDLTEEFFRAFASSAKVTLHIWVRSGTNTHHMIEAAFKAFARALREAVSIDPYEPGVPSTKGTLNE
jgi:imidazoleglycerol-phosphate dehydratase